MTEFPFPSLGAGPAHARLTFADSGVVDDNVLDDIGEFALVPSTFVLTSGSYSLNLANVDLAVDNRQPGGRFQILAFGDLGTSDDPVFSLFSQLTMAFDLPVGQKFASDQLSAVATDANAYAVITGNLLLFNPDQSDHRIVYLLGPVAAPIPEPAPILLVATGLAGIGLLRRPRR